MKKKRNRLEQRLREDLCLVGVHKFVLFVTPTPYGIPIGNCYWMVSKRCAYCSREKHASSSFQKKHWPKERARRAGYYLQGIRLN